MITDSGTPSTLTKELTGTLILNTANTYTGTTYVYQGALQVQQAQGLGGNTNGTEVKDGGQLQLQTPTTGIANSPNGATESGATVTITTTWGATCPGR